MKKLLLSMTMLLTVAAATAQKVPEWLKSAAIYHIYPSTFMDNDGDGIGDLEGIRSKLDYIKDLGFNTIWMSPCFKSEFEDGGYDITDFYMVDPRFGTNTQLVRLIDEAHAKGIRVCLDLVAGHTSDKHPWFVQSCNADTDLQYSDYFIWSDSKSSFPTKKFVKSDAPRNGNYLKNFFDIQPALNYGYADPDPAQPWQQGYDDPGPTAVRQEIKNIMAFWMNKGVDGFRCDMAQSLVKNDDKHHTATMRLWHEMRTWLDENFPECVLLSEWSQPRESIRAGFHIDLIIHNGSGYEMYRPLVCNTTDKGEPTGCFFDRAGKGQLKSFVENYDKEYHATRDLGFASMPTCSHDIWRLNRNQRSTPEELKTALTFFITMPWVPIVYYGEEIGMRNIEDAPVKEGSYTSRNRSSCRTPMQWDDTANAGFSTAPAESIYLPIDPDPARPTVAAQQNDPASILSYVRGLLALRAATPALGTGGDWRYIGNPDQPYPMVYLREKAGEKYIVVLNPSGRSVTAQFPAEGDSAEAVYGTDLKTRYTVRKGTATVKMKPVSATLFHVK